MRLDVTRTTDRQEKIAGMQWRLRGTKLLKEVQFGVEWRRHERRRGVRRADAILKNVSLHRLTCGYLSAGCRTLVNTGMRLIRLTRTSIKEYHKPYFTATRALTLTDIRQVPNGRRLNRSGETIFYPQSHFSFLPSFLPLCHEETTNGWMRM
ncbi:hypothetical protein J6590_067945 [Homalodisca vitripennis]|nr:hypothetical protein J6590_067945 [Homalodisca vitripennis]